MKYLKEKPRKLTEQERKLCHTIIHSAATAATTAASGLAQIPLADNTVITPIQITMIISLGKVFGYELKKSAAKGIIAGAASAFIGRGIAQILWGWIPIAGNLINASTAGALTEAIGWYSVKEFRSKKNFSQTYPTPTDTDEADAPATILPEKTQPEIEQYPEPANRETPENKDSTKEPIDPLDDDFFS